MNESHMDPERHEALRQLAQRLNITLCSYELLDEALTHCPPAVSEYVVRHW